MLYPYISDVQVAANGLIWCYINSYEIFFYFISRFISWIVSYVLCSYKLYSLPSFLFVKPGTPRYGVGFVLTE